VKIKTSELIGPALDWAVAKCECQAEPEHDECGFWLDNLTPAPCYLTSYQPSTDWRVGGPILSRERISWNGSHYAVHPNFIPSPEGGSYHPIGMSGADFLVAGLRCFVARKLGLEVDIPEELS
jgi:hypothetical protein